MTILLKWKKLNSQAQIPKEASSGAACFDLVACLDEAMLLKKNEVNIVPTGLSCEIPDGFEMQIRARSGLAFKHGIMLVNGVGTIDSDYRGELKILLTSFKGDFTIQPGDRIAQALISPVPQVKHVLVEDLSSTERAQGGFGSTGINQNL